MKQLQKRRRLLAPALCLFLLLTCVFAENRVDPRRFSPQQNASLIRRSVLPAAQEDVLEQRSDPLILRAATRGSQPRRGSGVTLTREAKAIPESRGSAAALRSGPGRAAPHHGFLKILMGYIQHQDGL